ncbi:hypothetical protein MNEG_12348 [Monoraphidium neglectum]|uniref:BAH domain-containing protein n=1 Tax=Monoraphidium neglectum TaxID=145388 RepID=A0A0D2KIL3_9CHLO|nr:hypothetical protein MNEG_12348 [Monoraphidium neglectum]KIY95613.1 hypothetical protein MNEG_12348 [Monoraphidium neglectum]|eukprot:XP_013894633.1 hypothetical protein MNEG_12348 [Monoraphidium neglectum]
MTMPVSEGPRAPQNLTFNWIGAPEDEGDYQYYSSFQFCDNRYDVGDHVYLIPEDVAAPLYLARIINAFEDSKAEGSERLCIQQGASPI